MVFRCLQPDWTSVTFQSRSGPLAVARDGELLTMDFPAWEAAPCEAPAALLEGLGTPPVEVLGTRDYLALYRTEEEVRALRPDMERLRTLDRLGVIVTAPGSGWDFVSRFFAPGAGIPEDPVTGSAHCTLAPYWAARLGKSVLRARQVSPRGGELFCECRGDRLLISGQAVCYLEGTIFV